MQAAKQACNTSATCDLNIWIFGEQTDLSFVKYILGQSIGIDETNTFQLTFF